MLFWSDHWLPLGPLLHHCIVQPVGEELQRRVCDYWVNERGWDWISFSNSLNPSALISLASMLLDLDESKVDVFGWLDSNGGIFSVESAYQLQRTQSGGLEGKVWKWLWSLKVQARVRVFMWIVSHDRILANFARWRRKLTVDSFCALCGVGVESTIHALRDCDQAREVWDRLVPPQLVDRFYSTTLRDWLEDNLGFRRGSGRNAKWPEIMSTICWRLWKWRNNVVFRHDSVPIDSKVEQIICNVRELELLWGCNTFSLLNQRSFSPESEPSVVSL